MAKSTPNIIPTYHMNHFKFTSSTLKRTDKIKRDFTWGSTSYKRNIHYLTWTLVTKPKAEGGLDIITTEHKNNTR